MAFSENLNFNEKINFYIPGPLIRKKKAPVSLATALAIKVLPVPGGPNNKIPLGGFTPIALNKLQIKMSSMKTKFGRNPKSYRD